MSGPEGAGPGGPVRPVVLVTGLSGAGKFSILRALEDMGYETVDNPPLRMLEQLVGPPDAAGGRHAEPEPTMPVPGETVAAAMEPPLAAGVDARTRDFSAEGALTLLARLRARRDLAVTLVYATADEAALLRRYTETRRRHPLADPPDGTPRGPGGERAGNRVADGIARERRLLAPLREAADVLIDTTELPLPELRRTVERQLRPDRAPELAIGVLSFAFPKGLPTEADLVFDLRFLRNPHYVPELRPRTGLDPAVAAYVEADPDWAPFWGRLLGFVTPLLPRYVAEGKKYLTIALGCTGGRHRSVLVARRLADHLDGLGWRADAIHREVGGEIAGGGGGSDGSGAAPSPALHPTSTSQGSTPHTAMGAVVR